MEENRKTSDLYSIIFGLLLSLVYTVTVNKKKLNHVVILLLFVIGYLVTKWYIEKWHCEKQIKTGVIKLTEFLKGKNSEVTNTRVFQLVIILPFLLYVICQPKLDNEVKLVTITVGIFLVFHSLSTFIFSGDFNDYHEDSTGVSITSHNRLGYILRSS